MEKRLKELGFRVSDTETPADESCMFHALLDQIQSNSFLPPYAESHWELRYKIVCEGYEKFIDKLSWPEDPDLGSKREWKCKMLNPSVWGDEVVLHLASNLLQVDIHIIPAFSESSCNNGVTIIKPLQPPTSQKQPIYLFFFSDSDFSPAHYQSVWPSSLPPSLPPSQNFEVTDLADLTDLVDCRDMQIVVVDQPR